jgi:drug/metabolite transporter (DMT)-like permease
MWNPLDAATLYLLFFIGILGGIAQILLTYSYKLAPASYVAPFSYLSMVFAIAADVVIWGIWPDWQIYAGCFIIMASGLFIVYREVQKKKTVTVRPNLYSLQPVMPTQADTEKGRTSSRRDSSSGNPG